MSRNRATDHRGVVHDVPIGDGAELITACGRHVMWRDRTAFPLAGDMMWVEPEPDVNCMACITAEAQS